MTSLCRSQRYQFLLQLLVCLLPVLCTGEYDGAITEEAPAFTRSVTEYFQSATFLESIRACCPNCTSFPELDGPQSQCLLAPGVVSELVEQLGGTLIGSFVALEELNRISAAGGSPNIILESSWANGIMRTLSEVFYGRNQFGLGELRADSLKPTVWQMPSPIASSSLNDRQKTELILGESCLDGSISVKIGSHEQLRTLKAQEPNVSLIVATARISDSGSLAISGRGLDEGLFENRFAAAAAKIQGLSSQGPLYPRAQLLLYYRTDWFEELGASVPNTWDELIALARSMSGLDSFVGTEGVGPNNVAGYESFESWPNPRSMPDEPIELQQAIPREKDMGGNDTRFALCLDLAPYCQGGYVLNAILASMSQTQGTWQNAFMDPVSMELLSIKHPELMEEVLQVYHDLAQASHLPTSLHSCSAVSHLFATGRCAMTINWEYAFIYLYNSPRLDGTRTTDSSNSSKPHPAAESLVGNVGVSPLPGSSRVYDRGERVVKECNPSTCPLANQDMVSTYSRISSELPANLTKPSNSSSSSSSQGSQSHRSGTEVGGWSERSSSTSSRGKQSNEAGSQQEQKSNSVMGYKQLVVDEQRAAWVNRAPYSVYTPGIKTLCNPSLDSQGRDTGEYQTNLIAAASRALNNMILPLVALETSMGYFMAKNMVSLGNEASTLAYTLAHKGNLGSPGDAQQAWRQELLRTPEFPDQELDSWWRNQVNVRGQKIDVINDDMFIDNADSRRFFQALWKASYEYRNQAPEFLATEVLTQGYRLASAEVAFYAASSPTFSLQRAVQGFKNRSTDAQNVEVDEQALQAAVWRATGFDSAMIDALSSSSSSSSTLSEQEMAGAIIGPILFVFLAAILLLVFLIWRQRLHDHRNLLGVILPPKAGPQTTLLLTDIESSTQMWETLPEHVCDEVISLHHEVIRKKLHMHHGYECGTEGDAFVLAFHAVPDALLFAASARVELLLADWPAQLLELEACRPVYVPLPLTPDRNQGAFMKHLRKSEDVQQDFSSALQDTSGPEVAVTVDSTSVLTQPFSKWHNSQAQSTSRVMPNNKGGSLSRLKAFCLCRSLQQEMQAHAKQPHPLNTLRLWLTDEADASTCRNSAAAEASCKGSPEVCQQRGKSSGLLAFDAALLSTATNNGDLNKGRKENKDTGLDCADLVKRFPSRFSILPDHISLDGDPSNSVLADLRASPLGIFGSSPVDESPFTAGTSSSGVLTSNADTEHNGSKLVPSRTSEPGSGRQDSRCIIKILTTHTAASKPAVFSSDKGKANLDARVPALCSQPRIDRAAPTRLLPTIPRNVQANTPRTSTELTVGQQFLATMPRTFTPGPGRLLVLRGLRVRMGVASGVERQEDVQMRGAQGRAQYSGPAMAAARAVVDAAQGGMVLISPETFQQIPAKLLQKKLLVASMGEHVLGKGQEQICLQLYQVLPRQLVHRAAQLGPVRSIHQLSHGFLEAPSNSAAICFMNVSYMKALELWNPDVTAAALELWHTTVQGILIKRGGYLVEAGDGLCLAAFSRPSSAIRWALECIEACLNADWPAELLETEFGEEQYFMPMQRRNISRNSSSSFLNVPPNAERDEQVSSIGSVMPSASFPHLQSERVLFFRGLRMKVGIDWGAVKADLHAATARVTFRGRVMNRAARISSVAKCGQVWCSEGAWETAAQEINKPDPTIVEAKEEGQEDNAEAGTTLSNDSSPEIRFVNATPLGPYQLKGIAQNVELYHCY